MLITFQVILQTNKHTDRQTLMKTTSACSIELRTFVKSTRMRNTTFVAQLMNIYEIFVNLFGNIEIVARKPLKWPGSEEEKHQYNYENKKPVKN